MQKLFRFLTLLLFSHLGGTTMYAMVKQKGAQIEQKIPEIKATGPQALYCEIHKLLQEQYAPQSIVTALKQQNIYIGYTVLHIALGTQPSYTSIQIAQILVDAGVDVNVRINNPESNIHDSTLLHTVLFAGFLEYVPILLNAHADVNARINNPGNNPGSYRHGWRPLDEAAYQCLTDKKMSMVVRSLVAHGADIRDVLRKVDLGFTITTRKQIINAIIHGKMDRARDRARERIKLTALFNELQVLGGIPAGVKRLAVAYDGGDHPARVSRKVIFLPNPPR